MLWAIVAESVFLFALAGAVIGLVRWRDRKKRLPFTQKILRPPGESLRLRLIELDEQLNDRFVQLFLLAYSPLLVGGLIALQGARISFATWLTIIVLVVILSAWATRRLWKETDL